ncbi:hypothetical protein OBBRIDRAFT_839472 [Obba rivulosa]|uniref:HTH La-type RNA-binding domain-containing protein n=1 Tax=Obba rivulosa TaxID=1052685 RepID=A0A8E2AQB4_9APHY|nr:hypothetical protein OBBRIDRAFT_839472 [Obba rivulosa]
MVSPPASSNPRPLSYADRAKKAQNLKPQNAPQQRISPQNASAPSSSIPAPNAPSSSTMTTSRPSSPVPAPASTVKGSNGDASHADLSPAPSAAPQQKAAAPPPVNVWTLRKEQMAAQVRARTNQGPSQEKPPPSKDDSEQTISPSPFSPQAVAFSNTLPAVATTSATAQNIANHHTSPATTPVSATNGHAPLPNSPSDDPFIVRPNIAPRPVVQPATLPPAIDDAESWPEVGKSVTTPNEGSSRRSESREKESGEHADGGHEREGSQSQATPRKSASILLFSPPPLSSFSVLLLCASCQPSVLRLSVVRWSCEKTKWVPIPPEELQAAADANRPQHLHGRNRQQHHSRHQGSTSASASGSASGAASHSQSRTHSATGMRQSLSHASSAAHSQVQSRTGSVHSSPRQPPRGMKSSPLEMSVTGVSGYTMHPGSANRSMRSSRAGSPQQAPAPFVPPPDFVPGYAGPAFQGPGVPPAGPIPRSALPEQLRADTSNGTTYYQPVPPPLSAHPSSYHSSRGPGSPVTSTYPLPYPGAYGPPQGAMPPIPVHPGYGTPPYPVYNPYGYPYAQPYGFWPQGTPPSAVSPPPPPSGPSEGGLPPPTMMVRPPPPGESDAVAGYRDVGFAQQSDPQARPGDADNVERGRRARELSFGSIGIPGAGKSPSPQPPAASLVEAERAQLAGALAEDADKSFTTFSIGIAPGEIGPVRIRSRTRSKGHLGSEASVAGTAVPEQPEEAAEAQPEAGVMQVAIAVEEIEEKVKVVDLTGSDTKWQFGTAKQADEPTTADVTPSPMQPNALGMSQDEQPIPIAPAPFVPQSLPQPPAELDATHIPTAEPAYPVPHNGLSPPPFVPQAVPPPAPPPDAGVGDEWEVRDYGYGFGRPGGPSYPPYNTRDDRGRDRRDFPQDRESHGRPRRGSYSGYGYERGGFGGRRGRGANGFGRGFHGRSFSRGGFQGRQPPFTVAQPPPPPPPPSDTYYPQPPSAPITTYIPPGYDPYAYPQYPPAPQAAPAGPPMPMPQSPITFPLDPTRYYLLGQLEYYLSSQNMAQDFFLRQQMDSRGWIPIALIASFNRVKQLTLDMQTVRDVLILSSLVEVRDGWVRMRQWEQFVLPNAAPSTVEGGESPQSVPHAPGAVPAGDGGSAGSRSSHEGEGEEDEEEDVVFVMGKEADPSWTPA